MADQENDDETNGLHYEAGGIVFEKPKSQEEIDRETHDREQHEFARDQVKTNKKLAWFTGLLVVGTFIGTAIGIWQASIAQTAANAARDAAKAAQGALEEQRLTREQAATEAADARKASATESSAADQRNMAALEASAAQNRATLNATINSSRDDQRAWIGLVDFRLDKEPLLNQDVKVTFTLQNTGKTPALKINVKEYISIQPAELDVPDWSSLSPGNNGILSPGASIKDTTAIIEGNKVTRGVLAFYSLLRLTPNSIWVRVRVDYEDVFGRPHWLQACGKHTPATNLDRFGQCLKGIGVDPTGETRRH